MSGNNGFQDYRLANHQSLLYNNNNIVNGQRNSNSNSRHKQTRKSLQSQQAAASNENELAQNKTNFASSSSFTNNQIISTVPTSERLQRVAPQQQYQQPLPQSELRSQYQSQLSNAQNSIVPTVAQQQQTDESMIVARAIKEQHASASQAAIPGDASNANNSHQQTMKSSTIEQLSFEPTAQIQNSQPPATKNCSENNANNSHLTDKAPTTTTEKQKVSFES